MRTVFEQAVQAYNTIHAPKTLQPKAVLFDMDGVLYRSMHYHARAWHETMARHHIDMSEEEAFRLEGMRGLEIIRMKMEAAHRTVDAATAQRIYDEKGEKFSSYGSVTIMEGILDLMKAVRTSGMTVGVVTGSGQHSLLDKLEHDFRPYIDRRLVVTSFDVEQGKPAPDPYLQGLQKVHALPHETLVVENAPLGVRSAVAAGIFTIAVNTGPLEPRLLSREGASLVFHSVADLHRQWPSLMQTLAPAAS